MSAESAYRGARASASVSPGARSLQLQTLDHQPQIFVFDEATSALDVHTEAAVLSALQDAARERTLVSIAHRLDTVRRADHVLVLVRGQVVDEGPPHEVLARFRERVAEVLVGEGGGG